jgi:hypothetical protein
MVVSPVGVDLLAVHLVSHPAAEHEKTKANEGGKNEGGVHGVVPFRL